MELEMSSTIKGNSRGRPPISKVITFSTPPASMISQLLRKKRHEMNNPALPKNLDDPSCKKSLGANSEFIQMIVDSDSNESFEIDQNSQNYGLTEKTFETYILPAEEALLTEGLNKPFTFIPKEKEVGCQICYHRSTNYQEHKKHLSTHKINGQFLCPTCNYKSNLSCNLIKHVRVHRTDKAYQCDECTFRSNFINSLKAHKRIHSGEKPYSCSQCVYFCNSISNLKKHNLHRHSKSCL